MRNKPTLTSADAKKMMAACLAEATKQKWNVTIAIVDTGVDYSHPDLSGKVTLGPDYGSGVSLRMI